MINFDELILQELRKRNIEKPTEFEIDTTKRCINFINKKVKIFYDKNFKIIRITDENVRELFEKFSFINKNAHIQYFLRWYTYNYDNFESTEAKETIRVLNLVNKVPLYFYKIIDDNLFIFIDKNNDRQYRSHYNYKSTENLDFLKLDKVIQSYAKVSDLLFIRTKKKKIYVIFPESDAYVPFRVLRLKTDLTEYNKIADKINSYIKAEKYHYERNIFKDIKFRDVNIVYESVTGYKIKL